MTDARARCGWAGCTRRETTVVERPAPLPSAPGQRSWAAGTEAVPACDEHAPMLRAEIAARWGLPPAGGADPAAVMSDADVIARGVPSAVLLEPRTDATRAWLNERTHARRWQWTAMGVAVDWRSADSLIDELRKEGFSVEDLRTSHR